MRGKLEGRWKGGGRGGHEAGMGGGRGRALSVSKRPPVRFAGNEDEH